MSLRDDVAAALNEAHAAPYLVVGSGLSRRYLNTPDWEGLLRQLCASTGRPYEYFRAQSPSSLPGVASLMADAFYERWWSDEEWEADRAQRSEDCTAKSSPLKFLVADKIQAATRNWVVPSEFEAEIDALRRAEIDGIITTNWDLLLETIFPEYDVFVGQQEAIFARSYGIGELFKIHGCATKPNSIILTAEDYDGFNHRNVYLAAKLTTLFLEHPIVFLGYSLSDENVHQTLQAIIGCLEQPQLDQLSRRLFFVSRPRVGEVEGIGSAIINVGSRDLRVSRIITSSFESVFEALGSFQRKFPAKLLRQIKQHVYELVHSSDPVGELAVIGIEDLDSLDNVQVVVGVGTLTSISPRGLEQIEVADLFDDLLDAGTAFDSLASDLVQRTIEGWFQRKRKYVPLYKYLSAAGFLDENRIPIMEALPPKVRGIVALPRTAYMDSAYSYRKASITERSVADIESEYGPDIAARYLTLADFDLDELHDFLLRHRTHLRSTNGNSGPFRQLACIYDRRRHSAGFVVPQV